MLLCFIRVQGIKIIVKTSIYNTIISLMLFKISSSSLILTQLHSSQVMFSKGHTLFLQSDEVTSLPFDVFALKPMMS